jgi:hypothetical protein
LNTCHRHQQKTEKPMYDAHCDPGLACPPHEACLEVEAGDCAKDGH